MKKRADTKRLAHNYLVIGWARTADQAFCLQQSLLTSMPCPSQWQLWRSGIILFVLLKMAVAAMTKYTVTLIPPGSVIWLCLVNWMSVWYLWMQLLIDLQSDIIWSSDCWHWTWCPIAHCVADFSLSALTVFSISGCLNPVLWKLPSEEN